MTKKYKCPKCGVKYKALKPNFSKDSKAKSGRKSKCKTCYSDDYKKWFSEQAKEKKLELRKNNCERNKKYRQSEKYKAKIVFYNKNRYNRRKELKIINRNSERLVEYVKKYYWEEKASFFLIDIKPEEY